MIIKGQIQQGSSLTVSTTKPDPNISTIWYDPNTKTLFVWDGSQWQDVSAHVKIVYSETQPEVDHNEQCFWIKHTDKQEEYFVHYKGEWFKLNIATFPDTHDQNGKYLQVDPVTGQIRWAEIVLPKSLTDAPGRLLFKTEKSIANNETVVVQHAKESAYLRKVIVKRKEDGPVVTVNINQDSVVSTNTVSFDKLYPNFDSIKVEVNNTTSTDLTEAVVHIKNLPLVNITVERFDGTKPDYDFITDKETKLKTVVIKDSLKANSSKIYIIKNQTSTPTAHLVGSSTSAFDIFNDGHTVATWTFDNSADDLSGNFNGIWSGNALYGSGKFDKSAVFNGSNYITIQNGSELIKLVQGPFSISMWIKPTSSTPNVSRYIDVANIFMLASLDSGQTLWVLHDDQHGHTIRNTYKLPYINDWIHVVVTYDGYGHWKVYINGEEMEPSSRSSGSRSIQGSVYFGKSTYSSDPLLKGEIDQTRIFNRVITPDEVRILLKEETVTPPTEGVVYEILNTNLSSESKITSQNLNPSLYKRFDIVEYDTNLKFLAFMDDSYYTVDSSTGELVKATDTTKASDLESLVKAINNYIITNDVTSIQLVASLSPGEYDFIPYFDHITLKATQWPQYIPVDLKVQFPSPSATALTNTTGKDGTFLIEIFAPTYLLSYEFFLANGDSKEIDLPTPTNSSGALVSLKKYVSTGIVTDSTWNFDTGTESDWIIENPDAIEFKDGVVSIRSINLEDL